MQEKLSRADEGRVMRACSSVCVFKLSNYGTLNPRTLNLRILLNLNSLLPIDSVSSYRFSRLAGGSTWIEQAMNGQSRLQIDGAGYK